MIGPISVLGWVMAVGWLAAIGPALISRPTSLGVPEIAGLVTTGLSHNIGLLLVYRALSIGRVSIVAPIASTEGAGAALLAVALGDSLAATTAVILAVTALGVVFAAAERSADPDAGPRLDPGHNRQAAIYAIAAAATFSVGLVLSGRLGAGGMPPAWVMLVSRTVGLTVIVLPLVATRRFRLTRRALPFVVIAGLLEVFGGGIYVVGASQNVAIAAVVSSQFAALAAIGGFFLFGERLQRLQVLGVVIIVLGVTALAALQA
jgi:uncharacterized membrane protein